MRYLQNLHTHTTFCDGKNSPRELLEIAIGKGFDSIGFSGHSYMSYSALLPVTLASTRAYKEEIRRLKVEYEGRIKVFLGLEADMFSEDDFSGLDYVIGSVHYLKTPHGIAAFDRQIPAIQAVIDEHYAGDGLAFARDYYAHLAELPKHGSFDIVGHFDLCDKHGKNADFFDTESRAYREAAIGAAEALAGKIPYFEVNTGCMPRGYRPFPYPAPFLLPELRRLGFGAVISSDCHNADYLDAGFEAAAELLRAAGFREYYILTDTGFSPVLL